MGPHVQSASELIERADATRGVFVAVTRERARKEAQAKGDSNSPGGQVDGLVVAWKDVFDVDGYPTRCGTAFLADTAAEADHPLVSRLSDLGAICLGKTSMSELAFSALGENEVLAAPTNPHDTVVRRVCGGSSSGAAAAVAMSLVDGAIGTDNGGSVRLPAAWCGVVGFKPSAAAVTPCPSLVFSPSLDTIGPLASSVSVARRLFGALTGHEVKVAQHEIRFLRPLLPEGLVPESSVSVVVERALAQAAQRSLTIEPTEVNPVGATYHFRASFGSVADIECMQTWRHTVLNAGSAVSGRLRSWFESDSYSATDWERIVALRTDLISWFARSVPAGTVFVLPSSPIEPPAFTDIEDPDRYDALYKRSNSLLWPFNTLDAPSISVPCGTTRNGLPVGLQVVAPQGRDADVLAAAEILEEALT